MNLTRRQAIAAAGGALLSSLFARPAQAKPRKPRPTTTTSPGFGRAAFGKGPFGR